MILCFPDLDTLKLVVTSGLLPADTTLAPADVFTAADGRLYIDTPLKLSKKAAADLSKLQVVGSKVMPGEAARVSCWLEIIPVAKDAAPPQLSAQAPVLFELSSARDLPAVVGEMIRLGNDRQSFRWVVSPDDPDDPRVLLRVIGPPYYTLLRAIDKLSDKGGPVRAYTEQAPRVWVELGHSHPFAGQVKLADGQVLLVRGPKQWTYLPDLPFQDVYDILQFKLPRAATEWKAADDTTKLTVPLKLVPGNAADTPELWVLRGDGIDQLDQFVKEADERLTQRLRFAVAESKTGEKVVVLKVGTTRGTPPAVQLAKAFAYRSHSSLANLFVPVGARLHPQLRRDAVRTLLADDLDAVVWLHPTGDGGFVPESIPDASFHPLDDWVDYVIETAHAPLTAWVEATRFDFAQFVCTDEKQQKPKGPDKGPKDRPKSDKDAEPLSTGKEPKKGGKKGDEGGPAAVAEFVLETQTKKPNEWKIRREELQKKFLAVDGPLDHPERLALWPQLGIANAGAGEAAEASLCWTAALWEQADPDPACVAGWLRTEFPQANGEVTADEFAKLLTQTDPPVNVVRRLGAAVYALAGRRPVPKWLTERLTDVQKYIEANEEKMGVRAAWLAATRIAKLGGADVLGLARMRDRLLQRLLDKGLNPEIDLPFFLRTAGLNDSERVRLVRDEAAELHKQIRKWAEAGSKLGTVTTPVEGNATAAYVDLEFAYGLAKLGETQAADKLADAARAAIEKFPADAKLGIASRFLFKAYRHRVEQAAHGQPLTGRLPPALYAELEEINKKSKGVSNSPHGEAHYAITRMQQQSRVLEPHEDLDPYKKFTVDHEGGLKKRLHELAAEHDPQRLAARIREEYRGQANKPDAKDKNKTPPVTEGQFLVLYECLPLSARAGSSFAAELLRLVPDALRQSFPQMPELSKKQGRLLERSLFLAGHFDHREVVTSLVDTFVEAVAGKPEDQRYELINVVAGSCLRSLRKLGLRDDIDHLLRRLKDVVLGKATFKDLKARFAGRPDQWVKPLQSMLNLAGGWLTFGMTEQAVPILDEARAELLAPTGGKSQPQEYARLAAAYIAAVGHGPAEPGLKRIGELFRKIEPTKITNSFTTAPFYSRLHLNVVEEVVLALVSDEFALGAGGRRWLEDDEFLVRRRIHADMKAHLSGSGL